MGKQKDAAEDKGQGEKREIEMAVFTNSGANEGKADDDPENADRGMNEESQKSPQHYNETNTNRPHSSRHIPSGNENDDNPYRKEEPPQGIETNASQAPFSIPFFSWISHPFSPSNFLALNRCIRLEAKMKCFFASGRRPGSSRGSPGGAPPRRTPVAPGPW